MDAFKQANKSPKINASEKDFGKINFKELINAIKYDNCVLFIGPEISLNKKEESLHELFYESISSKNTNYDKEEGFFMPNSERKLKTQMMTFYNEDFPSLNENEALNKLKIYEILRKRNEYIRRSEEQIATFL